MAKSRQSQSTARALVSPMFSWTNAVLKGGEMVLDSMGAAVRNARNVRVAVLPELEAPVRKRSSPRKAKQAKKATAPARRAKSKRRR